MTIITHTDFTADYNAGREAVLQDIREMGFESARDKWNMDNPGNPSSMAAYYYAKGGMDALAAELN